jgi:hypothetical protein
MKKTATYLILIFALAIACKPGSKYYYESETYTLAGNLSEKVFYGPPGYGQDTTKDERIVTYILKLYRPIDVYSEKKKDDPSATEKNVAEIQLVIKENAKVLPVNKNVSVKGKLFHGVSGHHLTAVLMDVVEIREAK